MSLMFSDGSRPRLTEGNRRPGNPAVLAGRPPALELPLATAAALTAAFLGGWLDLHSVWIERLVALVLLISALRFVQPPPGSAAAAGLGVAVGAHQPRGLNVSHFVAAAARLGIHRAGGGGAGAVHLRLLFLWSGWAAAFASGGEGAWPMACMRHLLLALSPTR